MERYTLQQRIEIIKIHYKNGEKFSVTVSKAKALFGRHETPSRPAIVKMVKKFELLGQVSDVKNPNRVRRSRTTENIAAVARSVDKNPSLSIPVRSLELGIPQTTLHRILHKDLGLKGGVIRQAGGLFGKLEAAKEEEYFFEKQIQQLEKLKNGQIQQAEFHQQQVKEHEKAIERHKKFLENVSSK